MTTLAVVLAAVVVLLLVIAPWLTGTARRLDRLHVRTDAAFAGLTAALDRRAVVARTIAATRKLPELAVRADAAEQAERRCREDRENDLTVALSTVELGDVPVAVRRELADAQQRVVLARNVYNSAVRDTLRLRRRRDVRLLRLSGTAALPAYFDIDEPDGPLGVSTKPLPANEDSDPLPSRRT